MAITHMRRIWIAARARTTVSIGHRPTMTRPSVPIWPAPASTVRIEQPLHGYFFRILTEQGANARGGAKSYMVDGKMTAGFAVVAFPGAIPCFGRENVSRQSGRRRLRTRYSRP